MAQDYRENLLLAMDTLRGHKLRSFLAVVGVVMGVGVLMLVGALIQGFRQSVIDSISSFGADTGFVSRFDQGPGAGGPRPKDERLRKPLTLADGEAIRLQSPAVKNITVWIQHWEEAHELRYHDNTVTGVDFRGAQPNYPYVYANATMKEGRFFTQTEAEHRVNVVVLGEDAAKALFNELPAVGHEVRVDGSTFMVIGVFDKPKGGFGGNDEDRRVIVPYETFLKLYPAAYENSIRFQAKEGMLDQAVDEAREVLRRRRNVAYDKPDTFSLTTSQEQVEQFNSIIGMVVLATVVISSIGLLIGGVGVMNIMLVSVTERTREIGVRKAIGARRGDITLQFLFEAMTLTGAGGLLGVVVIEAIVWAIRNYTSIPAVVPIWAVITGVTVSLFIGLVFGVWPAMKASRLDPVEALRYE
jgi:ABC-type antimicrobial peptide transport system permease subunit